MNRGEKYRAEARRRPLRPVLATLLCALVFLPLYGRAGDASSGRLADRIFDPKRYNYFNDYLLIAFDIEPAHHSNIVSGELLEIRSDRRVTRSLLMEWDASRGGTEVFFHSDRKFRRYAFAHMRLDSALRMEIAFDFRQDMVTLTSGPDTVRIREMKLSRDEAYSFALLPGLSAVSGDMGPELKVKNLSVLSDAPGRSKRVFFWYLFIIGADIVIFLFILLYYRRRKRSGEAEQDLLRASSIHTVELPRASAVYLFGGLKIYDRNGEDVSKRLSPMLRELLSILVVFSGQGGVPSSTLKDLLWFDMSPDNARNNRAVNFRKLRMVLSMAGNMEIVKTEGGNWKLEPGEVFVDYLYYKDILSSPAPLSREDVEKIISLARNGNILPETDYVWLDATKGEVSDQIIDRLLLFAESDAIRNNAGAYFVIAEAISKLERLNEDALKFRCKAYALSGRHQSAKNSYDRFCVEYKTVYGQDFPIPFTEVVK